ncbi:unnamed protein product [Arctogadus glacialis]
MPFRQTAPLNRVLGNNPKFSRPLHASSASVVPGPPRFHRCRLTPQVRCPKGKGGRPPSPHPPSPTPPQSPCRCPAHSLVSSVRRVPAPAPPPAAEAEAGSALAQARRGSRPRPPSPPRSLVSVLVSHPLPFLPQSDV